MIKYLRICCPHCRRRLKVRLEYLKLQVFCNHCHEPFMAEPVDDDHADSPLRFSIDAPLPETARRLVSPGVHARLFRFDPDPTGTSDRDRRDAEDAEPEVAESQDDDAREAEPLETAAAEEGFVQFAAAARAPHTEFEDLRSLVISLQAETELPSSGPNVERSSTPPEAARIAEALARVEAEADQARRERDAARGLADALRAELEQTRLRADSAAAEVLRLQAEAEVEVEVDAETERLRGQVPGAESQAETGTEPVPSPCNAGDGPGALPHETVAKPEPEPTPGGGGGGGNDPGLLDSAAPGEPAERVGLDIDPLDAVDQQFRELKPRLWELHQAELKARAQTALIDRLNRIWRQTGPKR